MAKQNRERKAAKQMMESLGGMADIKKAEKLEKQSKWKECIEHYEKGVEELEKSLNTLEGAKILSEFQVQQCQQQIDAYCRNLIKLQRAHAKDIKKEERAKKKRAPLTKFANKRSSLTSKTAAKAKKQSEYDDGDVDESDEAAVFGGKKKRESAVAMKKKEMARMKREMATGKVERPNGDDGDEKDKAKDDEDDMYSIYDRS